MTRSALLFLAALLGSLFCGGASGAPSYAVQSITLEPPQELAGPVREVLAGQALRVTSPGGVFCELWLRKSLPAAATAQNELGIVYGEIAPGTLVAAIRFSSAAVDYRQQKVKPGVYTLRYALLPVNGNHMGVSPNRDFLLLSPASADSSAANLAVEQLMPLSRKATGTGHPSVWSLAAPENSSGALQPQIVHQEDGNLWILNFQAEILKPGAVPSKLPVSLVVVGSAPEA